MISIQSAMLVILGFLVAGLVTLFLAPAFWNRAVRLTTRRMKERLPLTEEEIRADRDRLRAEYAITIHKLETKAEGLDLRRARDLIEINRRDASISMLERRVQALGADAEEHQNARRVLEQTIEDRLPKVEARLQDAKTLLFNRDREIAELTQTSRRNQQALDEAVAINSQQAGEITRLTSSLTTRGSRNTNALGDPRFEGELALLSELEALRTKSRDQALLISRLQSSSARNAVTMPRAFETSATGADGARLLTSDVPAAMDEARAQTERELRALRAQTQDQATELARLRAEAQTLKDSNATDVTSGTGVKESRIALKARLSAVQAQSEQQTETIRRLRVELAGANERLALQAAHFMDEMKRLGTGTAQTSAPQRRGQLLNGPGGASYPAVANAGRRSLSERVSQTRPTRPQELPADGGTPASVAAAPAAALATIMSAAVSDAAPAAVVPEDAGPSNPTPAKKARLLDRLSSVGKG